MSLTPKQAAIVKHIRDKRLIEGYSPTLQELANSFNVTKVTIFEHIEALIEKGVLQRFDRHKARSLSIAEDFILPDEEHAPLTFPLKGRIAAGYPIERMQEDETLDLEAIFGPSTARRGATFALQVDGDSMQDEGIFNGDYVIVERRQTARAGERVVALLPNGETTLKTFYKEPDGRIRLQPANEEFEPIIVDDCTIQGVVIGVLRRY